MKTTIFILCMLLIPLTGCQSLHKLATSVHDGWKKTYSDPSSDPKHSESKRETVIHYHHHAHGDKKNSPLTSTKSIIPQPSQDHVYLQAKIPMRMPD